MKTEYLSIDGKKLDMDVRKKLIYMGVIQAPSVYLKMNKNESISASAYVFAMRENKITIRSLNILCNSFGLKANDYIIDKKPDDVKEEPIINSDLFKLLCKKIDNMCSNIEYIKREISDIRTQVDNTSDIDNRLNHIEFMTARIWNDLTDGDPFKEVSNK